MEPVSTAPDARSVTRTAMAWSSVGEGKDGLNYHAPTTNVSLARSNAGPSLSTESNDSATIATAETGDAPGFKSVVKTAIMFTYPGLPLHCRSRARLQKSEPERSAPRNTRRFW